MGDTVSDHIGKQAAQISTEDGLVYAVCLYFGEMGCSRAFCMGCTGFPTKQGFPKESPFWHMVLLAKCSVLYLLSRLAGKMKVSLDGNVRFTRQETWAVSKVAVGR